MFLTIRDNDYWFVEPTERELKAVRVQNTVHKRSNKLGARFFSLCGGIILVLLSSVFTPWPLVLGWLAFGALIVMMIWYFGGFSVKSRRCLRWAAESQRLFILGGARCKYDSSRVMQIMLVELLCGGERKLDYNSNRVEVLRTADSDEIDAFIGNVYNRRTLEWLRDTWSTEVEECIRAWLEPRLEALRDPKVLQVIEREQEREASARRPSRQPDDSDSERELINFQLFSRNIDKMER